MTLTLVLIAQFEKRANAFYTVPASDESSQAIFSLHKR